MLVEMAALSRSDLVVEFGAGTGRLTGELAVRCRRVVAIEVDARLASRLGQRLQGASNVTLVHGDALAVPLPHEPFRVVCNPPFHITSKLLHRLLDDPRLPLLRADIVLGWGAALALTGVFGPAHKARPWQARFEFLLIRRLPATAFQPAPGQDAAVVSIRPRQKGYD
jgi:16S rRNA A1518/A1519 N6-dimethyltransferase RsmA/KsgA/DIM1 with predicted DNA glycosylase/AP lyase activity